MCKPHHSRCRNLTAALAIATAVVTVAAAVGAASAATKAAVTVGPHLAASDASAWQFPVPNWSHSNKEQGRVDDVLQIGGIVFVGGNFTPDHRPQRQCGATHLPRVGERRPAASLTRWSPSLNGRVYALADISRQLAAVRRRGVHPGQRPVVSAPGGVQHRHRADLTGATADAINGTVKAIAQAGSDLYIGGAFSPSVVIRISAWPSSARTRARGGRSTRAGTRRPTTRCAT